MSSIVISGDTSGSVTLQAPAVAGSTILTLPATTGTVALTSSVPSAATPSALGTVYGLTTAASLYTTALGYVAGGSLTGAENVALGAYSQFTASSGIKILRSVLRLFTQTQQAIIPHLEITH